MTNLVIIRRLLTITSCLTLVISIAGCGDGRKAVFPVHGQVLVDHDQPAAHALISFHPVGDKGSSATHPTGETDDQGHFTLTSFTSGDGAPAGEYEVTVTWFRAVKTGKTGDDQYASRNLLPGRYAKAETSKLKAVVREGPTELEPFRLSTK